MPEDFNKFESRHNECQIIMNQFRNANRMHELGVISDEEYYEQQGKYNACVRVIALIDNDTWVSDEEFLSMIQEEIENAMMPDKYEMLRADVDYAIMLSGGDI